MDDSRHRLPIGYHLNQKYEIRKVLGEGGFGITYLARDIVLDLDVAVKEYYPSGLVMREITNGCRDKGDKRTGIKGNAAF